MVENKEMFLTRYKQHKKVHFVVHDIAQDHTQ